MADDLKVGKTGAVSVPNVTRPPMVLPGKNPIAKEVAQIPHSKTVSPFRLESVKRSMR